MKKRTRLTLLICVVVLVFVIINNCDTSKQKIINPNDVQLSNTNNIQLKLGPWNLVMPDSIPSIVNKKALEIASKNYFGNIRILQADARDSIIFNILYFDDDGKEIKSLNVNLTAEQNKIIKVEDVSKLIPSIKKTSTYTCWMLAYVYTGSNYSGYAIQFSQGHTTYGWYHKVIWDLRNAQACCAYYYNGLFNDCISSYYWEDDGPNVNGRIARPVNFKVWEHPNRTGRSWDWEIPKYTSLYPVRNLHDTNFANDGCNNIVTSIDMFYRVFTPTQ